MPGVVYIKRFKTLLKPKLLSKYMIKLTNVANKDRLVTRFIRKGFC